MVRARVRAIRVNPNPNSPNPNNPNSPKKDYMLLWGFDSNIFLYKTISNAFDVTNNI